MIGVFSLVVIARRLALLEELPLAAEHGITMIERWWIE